MIESSKKAWVTRIKAQRILGVGRDGLFKLVDAGLIGVRRLPGLDPTFCKADCERLAEASTIPATAK